MIKRPIYLDYMATTPVDPRVCEVMADCLGPSGCFGNPSSQSHRYGLEAAERIKTAAQNVATLLNADPREIIWTSGATESNNLAIKGAALFYQRKGKHIITMQTEHMAVLDTCAHLESEGFEVTYLAPKADGLLDLDELKATIRLDTILVSIMHVNNETGVIQDLKSIGEITRNAGIIFHSDAAQSAGKIDIDLDKINVDLMSFSAHKIYGPKGIGTLYVRRQPRIRLAAQIHGGDHQYGLRSGTLATHQIQAMGEAFKIAKAQMTSEAIRIRQLRDRLWEGLLSIGQVRLNGHKTQCIPGCLNLCFAGIDSEILMTNLKELAISSGSACNSTNTSPSHVLLAMRLSREDANNSLRLSMGRFTTEQDVDNAIQMITEQARRLRSLSPLWNIE